MSPSSRILVVDDDVDTCEMLRLYLESRGHIAQATSDSQNAFNLALAFMPDICLMDLCMPTVDGCELALQLRHERRFDSSVLHAISGRADTKVIKTAASSGFDYFHLKPIDLEELDSAIVLPRSDVGMKCFCEVLQERCRMLSQRVISTHRRIFAGQSPP